MLAGIPLARRLLFVAVSVACMAVCCGLALWQWERYSSAGGSFQNLGYVLQWPLFGLFPAFVFWRFRVLRRKAEQDEAGSREQASSQREGASVPAPRRQPEARPKLAGGRGIAPRAHDEDDELAAYNRYLAELNARDQAG